MRFDSYRRVYLYKASRDPGQLTQSWWDPRRSASWCVSCLSRRRGPCWDCPGRLRVRHCVTKPCAYWSVCRTEASPCARSSSWVSLRSATPSSSRPPDGPDERAPGTGLLVLPIRLIRIYVNYYNFYELFFFLLQRNPVEILFALLCTYERIPLCVIKF